MNYDLFLFVILSIAKDLEYIHFKLRYIAEILPPFGRLDDNELRMTNKKLSVTPCTLW